MQCLQIFVQLQKLERFLFWRQRIRLSEDKRKLNRNVQVSVVFAKRFVSIAQRHVHRTDPTTWRYCRNLIYPESRGLGKKKKWTMLKCSIVKEVHTNSVNQTYLRAYAIMFIAAKLFLTKYIFKSNRGDYLYYWTLIDFNLLNDQRILI